MKIKPVQKAYTGHSYKDPNDERDRLIRIIDELIVASDIPSSYRFITSSGIVNIKKLFNLHKHVQGLEGDKRYSRIKNLLERFVNLYYDSR